jgi:hypothetical protein
MNLATLTIEGTEDALRPFIEKLGLKLDSRWTKGEPKPRGGQYASSGVSATIADAANPVEMVRCIREFLSDSEVKGIDFLSAGLSAELVIGITVGDSEQYVAFIDFAASDISLLATIGLALSVAAYPTSDAANAIEEAA